MKNGRVYIFPLITFVGYLPGENKNICRYLPLFANTKNAIIRLFVLFCGLMGWRNLPICSRKACKRPFCLFAACLRLANLRELCEYKQAQGKSLKTPKNMVHRRFFANHPPGYYPHPISTKRYYPAFCRKFFLWKIRWYLYFSYLWILIVKYFHFIMILNFRFLFFIFLIFSELWLVSIVLYVVC